jgi:hypothetical protein
VCVHVHAGVAQDTIQPVGVCALTIMSPVSARFAPGYHVDPRCVYVCALMSDCAGLQDLLISRAVCARWSIIEILISDGYQVHGAAKAGRLSLVAWCVLIDRSNWWCRFMAAITPTHAVCGVCV